MIIRKSGNKWATTFVLVAGLLPVFVAQAQQNADDNGFQASVGLHFDRNDNLFDSNSDQSESWIGRVSPELSLRSASGPRQLGIVYSGDYGTYFDSPDDDYDDHAVSGEGTFGVGGRGSMDLGAGFTRGHNARGTGLSQGLPPGSPLFPGGPDIFEEVNWSAQYTLGREDSRGRLELAVGQNDLEYTNNRDRTQFFDRNDSFASAGLSIGIQDRTSFVLDASYRETEYSVDRLEGSLDGDNLSFLVGVAWQASAVTEGSIRVGTQRRGFDDPGRGSGEWTASWDVAVRWSPRRYTDINLSASRANQETIAGGDFIDTTNYGISWTYEWLSDLESELSWNRRESDFVGIDRDQDENLFSLEMRFAQSDRLIWDASAEYRDRSTDGEIERLEFEGMLYSVGVNWQLIR